MELIAILEDGSLARPVADIPAPARDAIAATVQMYEVEGFEQPWVGYLALEEGICVGTCAYKGEPHEGSVEIAYFTFPGNEGRGIATRMATALLAIAESTRPGLTVTAQTQPQDNASTAVLRKLKFEKIGPMQHPQDGLVWEWRRKARTKH